MYFNNFNNYLFIKIEKYFIHILDKCILRVLDNSLMKLINYFLDNIDKYYEFLSNDLITSISKNGLQDIPNINLYGINACMKNHYVYYIINQLTKSKFDHRLLKTQKYNINVNNNNVEFNVKIYDSFQELNLTYKSNYDKHIISKYIVNIIKNNCYHYDKHIIILRDFDKLNFNAYMSLRRSMELYSNNTLFICVSTNISKIPDAIISRFLNIRCPCIDKKNLLKFTSKILEDLNITYYKKTDINKLIKNCDNDINKILFKLDADNFTNLNIEKTDDTSTQDITSELTDKLNNSLDINSDPIKYKDVLKDTIKNHINYLKKTKKINLVLQKNRAFIYRTTYFNYSNQEILEKFVEVIIKYFSKYLDCSKIIRITAETDNNIIKSSRDVYHYERYLLQIYKMFHLNN
tara:strand:+ start:2424 stop:3641 length:1218 start_codon:yes stop_codon:yes gene_type:complete